MSIDVGQIRKDFPILTRTVRDGRPLVYLDSANTSQKPLQVIDAIEEFYSRHNANIHRATHQLGEEATEAYEGARLKVAGFIGTPDESEVVFTKNISEGINLVAYALGNAATAGPEAERFRVGPGDEIVITEMEHHSNIVPWQLLAQRTGATLRWFGVTDDGRLDLSNIDELVNERTKIVALAHQSNVLGTVNPVREVAAKAHAVGALVLVDGAQAVPQMPVDVHELGVDFYGFTAHKLCGPTGIGVLWGRRELLEALPPFLGGGEMIETVAMERSTYAPPPHKFEAGTMPIAEAAGAVRRDRLPPRGRPGGDPRVRARAAGLRALPAAGDRGPAAPRPAGGRGSRRLPVVHARRPGRPGDPPARREPGPGRPRRGRTRRSPLRAPAAPQVRPHGQHACVAVLLQHARGDRRPDRRTAADAEILRHRLTLS